VNGDGCSSTCTNEIPGTRCGNGVLDLGEDCDDDNLVNGDGCSSTCTNEIPGTRCGNGVLDLGEDCDDGNLVNEDGCSSTCTNEIIPPGCGNGIKEGTEQCDDGNNVNGDGCSAICTDEMIPPGECTITSLAWNQTTAFEGETVRLNIAGTNCQDETFSFEVFEKDGFLNRDDSVNQNPLPIIFSPGTYGTWIAEWQDDDEGALGGQTNPPEYYFVVTINSTGEPIKSSDEDEDMLKVFRKSVFCFGINYCADYKTLTECEADLCTVGPNSIPEDIICGRSFNELTGCYEDRNCKCGWNFDLGICEGKWDLRETCEEKPCVPYVDDCWLKGDKCTDKCKCEDGYTKNGDGTCGTNNPNVCDENDPCWLTGDRCTEECKCEDGYISDGKGACIAKLLGMCSYTENNEDTCEDDGWLVRSLYHTWRWDLSNSFPAVPAGERESDYVQDPPGTYRYDPSKDSLNCKDKDETFVCPAKVQLSFFGFYQFVIAITIVAFIYLVYLIKKSHSKTSKNRKRNKKKK
jgi:cysteine-rich repeat protein